MGDDSENKSSKITLPVLMLGALVVLVLLLLGTGGHLPTITTSSSGSSAPPAIATGPGWDQSLISLALALTTRLLWGVPLLVVVAGALHLSHVWAHHARTVLIRAAIAGGLLLLVPVLIVLLPHVLQFRDHIVSELVAR